jgi:hypothetical protein
MKEIRERAVPDTSENKRSGGGFGVKEKEIMMTEGLDRTVRTGG